jgi:hypothetical protein
MQRRHEDDLNREIGPMPTFYFNEALECADLPLPEIPHARPKSAQAAPRAAARSAEGPRPPTDSRDLRDATHARMTPPTEALTA